jgi:hypothetical protein
MVLWLVFLALAIWQHALHSIQPPIYDSLSYLTKALHFWQAIGQGQLFNPLNLEPVARPPATVLMSYPFGFSPEYHSFHFRSVFIPILCMAVALSMVAGAARLKISGWWLAVMLLLLTSLPMFYHFDLITEIPGPVRWGLVDCFQGGIAAMAMAAVVRSLMTRSLFWLLWGVLLAALTLLIKPSGLMIMALVALVWLTLIILEWLVAKRLTPSNDLIRKHVVPGVAIIGAAYLLVLLPALMSSYISGANLDYARQVLAVAASVEMMHLTMSQALLLFHQSSGGALLLWLLLVGVLFIRQLPGFRRDDPVLAARVAGLLLVAPLVWGSGAWYWLVVQSGGNQIRYFFPFILMGVICSLPAAMQVCKQASRFIRIIIGTVCILPALNLALLLAAGNDPPLAWQKLAGVNVSIGRDREEIRMAEDFIAMLRKGSRNVQVYSFSSSVPCQVFENIGTYEGVVRPGLPGYYSAIPIDWVRGFAVRVDELLAGDYILIGKHQDQDAALIKSPRKFTSFDEERKGFELWFSTLGTASGVETVSESGKLRLLRISDRGALKRDIYAFVAQHAWRPEFAAANQPAWWSQEAVASFARNLVAVDTGFGGIYRVHAVTVNGVENKTMVDVWWEELQHEALNEQRFLFVHLLDAGGKIVQRQQLPLFPYAPPDRNRRWRHGAAIFPVKLPDAKVRSMVFGVSLPDGKFLKPELAGGGGNGKSIIIPLAAPPN